MFEHRLLSWYALVVKPRHEKVAVSGLRVKGFETFLPTYTARHRWADRYKNVELALFPGYVFCRFSPAIRSSVLSAPGLLEIVRIGKEPAPIPESEIETLQRIVSSGLTMEPWARLEVGQRVELDGGPLEGVQGRIIEIKKSLRLVVSVELLCRSVLVEIDRDWVRPLPIGDRLGSTSDRSSVSRFVS